MAQYHPTTLKRHNFDRRETNFVWTIFHFCQLFWWEEVLILWKIILPRNIISVNRNQRNKTQSHMLVLLSTTKKTQNLCRSCMSWTKANIIWKHTGPHNAIQGHIWDHTWPYMINKSLKKTSVRLPNLPTNLCKIWFVKNDTPFQKNVCFSF